ncbi:hypothetical protein [Aliiglaciecola sp. LCG003]|uniref:hypothetical protein n=1 Tax=Aliiglaciecola sp. LCG003 TaxID=3053655 RepID=UPI0025737BD5|nr:hypothetical protein [Aliiglaciecola sp. LCG003]WJG09198.1 hypothetical protein QR722_18005 [Aliiglaciecola sp. LCG003]
MLVFVKRMLKLGGVDIASPLVKVTAKDEIYLRYLALAIGAYLRREQSVGSLKTGKMVMNKIMKTTIAVLALSSTHAFAAMISNGDFSSCDYSGWQKDTDGFGDISLGNDFAIDNNAGNCRAAINVDHFDPAGDLAGAPVDEAFFANTLFQQLDFSGSGTKGFTLEFSYAVSSELSSQDPLFIADYFLVGLNDGSGNYFNQNGDLGFLIEPTEIDGQFAQTISFELDSSFANQTNWYLDFQLNIGTDINGLPDAFGSSLFIDDISLSEIGGDVDVNEPAVMFLLAAGLLGFRKRKIN